MTDFPSAASIRSAHGLVGRTREIQDIIACLAAGRHVLVEGPVGVGKTVLVQAVVRSLGRPFSRIDGDGRYTEAKLVGSFDPPTVLAKGYIPTAFTPGPLVRTLRDGGILFINELNRMPEGVQNVLLPSMDEQRLEVTNLGTIHASRGFAIIATQNPREFVATGDLAEALLDRFEHVRLDYQDEDEECEIVRIRTMHHPSPEITRACVRMVRATRNDPRIRRGASVRAAIAMADLAVQLDGDVHRAANLSLPTRIELMEDRDLPDILSNLKKKVSGSGPLSPRWT